MGEQWANWKNPWKDCLTRKKSISGDKEERLPEEALEEHATPWPSQHLKKKELKIYSPKSLQEGMDKQNFWLLPRNLISYNGLHLPIEGFWIVFVNFRYYIQKFLGMQSINNYLENPVNPQRTKWPLLTCHSYAWYVVESLRWLFNETRSPKKKMTQFAARLISATEHICSIYEFWILTMTNAQPNDLDDDENL